MIIYCEKDRIRTRMALLRRWSLSPSCIPISSLSHCPVIQALCIYIYCHIKVRRERVSNPHAVFSDLLLSRQPPLVQLGLSLLAQLILSQVSGYTCAHDQFTIMLQLFITKVLHARDNCYFFRKEVHLPKEYLLLYYRLPPSKGYLC